MLHDNNDRIKVVRFSGRNWIPWLIISGKKHLFLNGKFVLPPLQGGNLWWVQGRKEDEEVMRIIGYVLGTLLQQPTAVCGSLYPPKTAENQRYYP